eukprot:s8606_g3.t1
MCKRQWTQWKGSGKASYGGGWQQESASYWGDGSDGREDSEYPTYSHATTSAPARPPVEKPRTETAAAGLVKAVQRLVTAARKAEVRTRKLAEEQELEPVPTGPPCKVCQGPRDLQGRLVIELSRMD